jgi:hypothetical protein
LISTIYQKAVALQTNGRKTCRAIIPLQLFLFILCLQGSAAQEQKAVPRSTGSVGQISRTAESPIRTAGVPYQSGNRRDPFLNPLLLAKKEKPVDEEESRGTPPPGIAGTYIAQAVLQGTSVREDARVAIVRGADTRAYFLKEGARLFDGYLKTIERDSITLIRETKMRSGKILTQDVIKRLRTP